jgi:hypothetical protein
MMAENRITFASGFFKFSGTVAVLPMRSSAILAGTGKRARQLPIISEKLEGSHDTLRLRSGQA